MLPHVNIRYGHTLLYGNGYHMECLIAPSVYNTRAGGYSERSSLCAAGCILNTSLTSERVIVLVECDIFTMIPL